jgi:heme-degrading monooxygenase HmoA
MPFVSLTRLRLRSIRFLPAFFLHTTRSLEQVKSAPGFRTGALLADRAWTFWTMTSWDSQEMMRQFMISGPHKTAMSFLSAWCDEASVAHWDQPEETLPSWTLADQRMRQTGRPAKVKHPSAHHASLTYREPRTTVGGPIHKS